MATNLDKVQLPWEDLKEKKLSKVGEAKSETKSEIFNSLSENIKENKLFLKMKTWWADLSFSDQEKVYKMWKSADPVGIMPWILNIFPSLYTIFRHVKWAFSFDDFKLKVWANEMSFMLRALVQMNLLEMKLEDWKTKEQQVESIQKDIKSDFKRFDRYKWLVKQAIKLFVPEAKTISWEINNIDNMTKDELEKFKQYLIDQQLKRLDEKV